jgi:hypothetical protein
MTSGLAPIRLLPFDRNGEVIAAVAAGNADLGGERP